MSRLLAVVLRCPVPSIASGAMNHAPECDLDEEARVVGMRALAFARVDPLSRH